jgi:hypothetical protein
MSMKPSSVEGAGRRERRGEERRGEAKRSALVSGHGCADYSCVSAVGVRLAIHSCFQPRIKILCEFNSTHHAHASKLTNLHQQQTTPSQSCCRLAS